MKSFPKQKQLLLQNMFPKSRRCYTDYSFFLVEFGTTGELYKVGCTGDKNKLRDYWYSISRDVRYYRKQDTNDKILVSIVKWS